MANTISSDLVRRLVVDKREVLRNRAALIRNTSHKFTNQKGEIGGKIEVPVTSVVTAENDTAAQYGPDGTDVTVTNKTIELTEAKRSKPVRVTNRELQQYRLGSWLDGQIDQAIAAVIGAVSDHLFAQYYKIPFLAGTAGTSFFIVSSAASLNNLNAADKVLADNKNSAENGFSGVFTTAEFAKLKDASGVQQANYFGSDEVVRGRMDMIPNVLGFDCFRDQAVPKHTTGTITTGLAVKTATAHAAGVTSITATTAASTGACALKQGDIVTIDGYNYAIQADATEATAATDVTLTIDARGLQSALSGGEAITLATGHGTSYQNILGDLSGIALATALPEEIPNEIQMLPDDGDWHIPITDPVSGLTVCLDFLKQHRQRVMFASLVYGSEFVHPEKLVRGMGLATN